MHSSRMRTGRSLTVCRGEGFSLPRGGDGGLLAGVSPCLGGLPAGGPLARGGGSPCPGGFSLPGGGGGSSPCLVGEGGVLPAWRGRGALPAGDPSCGQNHRRL